MKIDFHTIDVNNNDAGLEGKTWPDERVPRQPHHEICLMRASIASLAVSVGDVFGPAADQ